MKRIKQKLNSHQGATLLMALMLMLVVMMVCYVIINAALSSGTVVQEQNYWSENSYDTSELNVTTGNYTFEFDGSAHGSLQELKEKGLTITADGEEITSRYSVQFSTDKTTWSNSYTQTSRGEYPAYLRVSYNGISRIVAYTLTITGGKGLYVTPPSNISQYYTESLVQTGLNGAATLGGADSGDAKVYYTYRDTNGVLHSSVTEAPVLKTLGSISVTAWAEGDGYDASEKVTYTLEIKKNPYMQVVVAADKKIQSFSYNNGTSYTGEFGISLGTSADNMSTVDIATFKNGGGSVYYTVGNGTESETPPTVSAMGDEKSVTVRLAKANYVDATGSFTIKIAKLQTLAITPHGNESKTFDGYSIGSAANVTLDGKPYTGSDVTVQYSTDGKQTWTTEVPTALNVSDSKTVDVKVSKTGYEDATDHYTLTITKGTVTLEHADDIATYNGSSHGGAAAASLNNVSKTDAQLAACGIHLEYSVNGGEWSTTVPSVKDVADGTKEVEVKAVSNNDNINSTNCNYTLKVNPVTEMVTITITGDSENPTYNGSSYTISGYTATSNDARYTQDMIQQNIKLKSGETASCEETNAGTYTMGLTEDSFTIENNTNFSNVQIKVTDGKLAISPYDCKNIQVNLGGSSAAYWYDGNTYTVQPAITITNAPTDCPLTANDFTIDSSKTLSGSAVNTYGPITYSASDVIVKNSGNFKNLNVTGSGSLTLKIKNPCQAVRNKFVTAITNYYREETRIQYTPKTMHTQPTDMVRNIGYSLYSKGGLSYPKKYKGDPVADVVESSYSNTTASVVSDDGCNYTELLNNFFDAAKDKSSTHSATGTRTCNAYDSEISGTATVTINYTVSLTTSGQYEISLNFASGTCSANVLKGTFTYDSKETASGEDTIRNYGWNWIPKKANSNTWIEYHDTQDQYNYDYSWTKSHNWWSGSVS